MGKKILSFIFLSFVLLSSFSVCAAKDSESKPSAESKPVVEIPPGLDFKTRVAQRRLLEINPFGGNYLGNRLENSYITGMRLIFRVTDRFSVGSEFAYNRIEYDPSSDFGQIVTTRNQFIADVFGTYSIPILQRRGKLIEEGDIYFTLGLGNMHINGVDRIMGVVGTGSQIYFRRKWLGLRLDTRTYMYSIPRKSGSKYEDDWAFTIGPSFRFLPREHKSSKTENTVSANY